MPLYIRPARVSVTCTTHRQPLGSSYAAWVKQVSGLSLGVQIFSFGFRGALDGSWKLGLLLPKRTCELEPPGRGGLLHLLFRGRCGARCGGPFHRRGVCYYAPGSVAPCVRRLGSSVALHVRRCYRGKPQQTSGMNPDATISGNFSSTPLVASHFTCDV